MSANYGASNIYAEKNSALADNAPMSALDRLFDLGDIIKALRLRKGIRGDKIPKALGVNKGTLSRIERTHKYDHATLDRIAAGLGTTQTELLAMRDALREGGGKTVVYCATHDDLHRKVEVVLHLQEFWVRSMMGAIEALYAGATGVVPSALPPVAAKPEEMPVGVAPRGRRRPRRIR